MRHATTLHRHMEYRQDTIKTSFPLDSRTSESEREQASFAYLMSLVAVLAGLPIPIINMVATLAFYWASRKRSYFVRWHATQALLSQLIFIPFNSYGFWWSYSIFFGGQEAISNSYLAYMTWITLLNMVEFIATIYAAIEVRKGKHVQWFFFSPLTNLLCKR